MFWGPYQQQEAHSNSGGQAAGLAEVADIETLLIADSGPRGEETIFPFYIVKPLNGTCGNVSSHTMNARWCWRNLQRWPLEILLLSIHITGALAEHRFEQRSCYYPNGAISLGRSCRPKDANSACCSPGFTCLDNGICEIDPSIQKHYKYTFYRSSCTDKTWRDPGCPKFCDGGADNRTAGHGLQECNRNGGTWCCRRDDLNCCSVPDMIIRLGKGEPILSFPKLHNPERTTGVPSGPTNHAKEGEMGAVNERKSRRATVLGITLGFALALLLFLAGATLYCMKTFRRMARAKELEMSVNSMAVRKDAYASTSVIALGEGPSSIELDSVSPHGSRRRSPHRRSSERGRPPFSRSAESNQRLRAGQPTASETRGDRAARAAPRSPRRDVSASVVERQHPSAEPTSAGPSEQRQRQDEGHTFYRPETPEEHSRPARLLR